MISIRLEDSIDKEIGQFVAAFNGLQKNIRNKYLKSAVRSAVSPHRATLRRNTPPTGTRRGRRKKGEKPQSTGALRRAVTVVVRAKKDVVYGVLGYKAGTESQKALWLEFGTKRGIQPRGIIAKTMAEAGPSVRAALPAAMAKAFENALKDKIPAGAGKYRGN